MIVMLLTVTLASAQGNRSIHGVIHDESGQGLAGVNIIQKGTTAGTHTDAGGTYTFEVSGTAPVLVFSFQGYQTKEVRVGASDEVSFALATDLKALNEVVVTATRAPKAIEDVPQKVLVIRRADIDKTIAADMTDLLKKTAGVDVIQYPGMSSGVGIRGFRPQFSGINQRTLVLIDGRPAGATNLATLDMNNVERVEVLKGPASALYGSQAMGGVVNIITRKTKGDVLGTAFAGIGSYGVTTGGFAFGGNLTSRLDVDASFKSYNQNKDFKIGKNNVFRDAFGWDTADRVLWQETGKSTETIDDTRGDGITRANTSYSNYSAAARVGYTLGDSWRIDVKADRFYAKNVNTPGDIENGNMSPGLKNLDRYSTDVIVKGKLTATTELTAKAFGARERTTNYTIAVDTTAVRSQFVSSDNKLTWQGGQFMLRQQVKNHYFSAGLDYTKVTQDNFSYSNLGVVRATSVRSPNFDQVNTGVYAQGELNFIDNRLNVTAGVRYERISYDITGTNLFPARQQSNNVVNPSVGINYNILPNVYLHGTFGTAFTTVGIFEIAGYSETIVNKAKDTVDVFLGNRDLKNQSSRTVDGGVRYVDADRGLSIDVSYFNTYFDNNVVARVIQYPGMPAESGKAIRNLNTYTNAKGTHLSGLEVDGSYDFGVAAQQPYSLKVFAGGVWIIKSNEIRDIYMQPEPLTLNMQNVADVTLNYGIGYDNLKWFSTRLSGRYVGRRYDTDWAYYSAANGYATYADVRYAAFMTLDWSASVRKDKHELSLLVNNLTDENYYEKRGYNLMGRNFLLRYTLHF